jgi:hypothetical protein
MSRRIKGSFEFISTSRAAPHHEDHGYGPLATVENSAR